MTQGLGELDQMLHQQCISHDNEVSATMYQVTNQVSGC